MTCTENKYINDNETKQINEKKKRYKLTEKFVRIEKSTHLRSNRHAQQRDSDETKLKWLICGCRMENWIEKGCGEKKKNNGSWKAWTRGAPTKREKERVQEKEHAR